MSSSERNLGDKAHSLAPISLAPRRWVHWPIGQLPSIKTVRCSKPYHTPFLVQYCTLKQDLIPLDRHVRHDINFTDRAANSIFSINLPSIYLGPGRYWISVYSILVNNNKIANDGWGWTTYDSSTTPIVGMPFAAWESAFGMFSRLFPQVIALRHKCREKGLPL